MTGMSDIFRLIVSLHPADLAQSPPEGSIHQEDEGGQEENVRVPEVILESQTGEVVQLEEGLQDGLHQPEVGGQAGGDDETQQDEEDPVLGQAGTGRADGARTFLTEREDDLETGGEEGAQGDGEGHDDDPDDQTSTVLSLLPDITGGHVLLSDHPEISLSHSHSLGTTQSELELT